MTVKLELSVEEVNVILGSLSKMPFQEVYKLIQKIYDQGSVQAQPADEDQVVEVDAAE